MVVSPEWINGAAQQEEEEACRKMSFIDSDKPVPNACIESFTDKFQDECLNQHWIANMTEAEAVINAWRQDYKTVRLTAPWRARPQ